MPTPSGPISLSHLRAEFGGATPDSLSEYYRGGSLVPETQSTSTIDGTAISASGLIRLGMFRNVTRVTYSIALGSPLTIDEGASRNFTVTTTGLPNGTVVYWTIAHGTTSAADFAATSGSLTLSSNSATGVVQMVADAATEGNETFSIQLRTGSTGGPVVATSQTGTINDTSTAPSGSARASGSAIWDHYVQQLTAPAEAYVQFMADGSTRMWDNSGYYAGPAWFSGGSPGTGYWIRGTTGHVDSGAIEAIGVRNNWIQISTFTPVYGVRTNQFNTYGTVNWNFDLSTTSNGSNIIRTWSNNTLSAWPNNL